MRAVGLGPLAGVLAIATTDIGILSKLFAEAIENVDRKQVDGVQATGANAVQRMRFGIIPQVLPIMISNVLYMFESNTRSATILGIVGAGGIGFHLSDRIRAHRWDEVGFIIIMIIVVVALIDFVSHMLRSRLIKAGTDRPLCCKPRPIGRWQPKHRAHANASGSGLGKLLAQHPRRRHLVAELAVGFVDADRRARARRKAAIGVEHDPFGGEILRRLPHARGDGFGGIDLTGLDADAAQGRSRNPRAAS